jgi:hypothetical protein
MGREPIGGRVIGTLRSEVVRRVCRTLAPQWLDAGKHKKPARRCCKRALAGGLRIPAMAMRFSSSSIPTGQNLQTLTFSVGSREGRIGVEGKRRWSGLLRLLHCVRNDGCSRLRLLHCVRNDGCAGGRLARAPSLRGSGATKQSPAGRQPTPGGRAGAVPVAIASLRSQ